MKTQQEVQELKESWEYDPVWDIEDTETFEEYHDELLEFRLMVGRKYADKRFVVIQKRADELNCSFELAKYVMGLENQLEGIETRLDELDNAVDWS